MTRKMFIGIILSFLGGASIDAVCGMESNRPTKPTYRIDQNKLWHSRDVYWLKCLETSDKSAKKVDAEASREDIINVYKGCYEQLDSCCFGQLKVPRDIIVDYRSGYEEVRIEDGYKITISEHERVNVFWKMIDIINYISATIEPITKRHWGEWEDPMYGRFSSIVICNEKKIKNHMADLGGCGRYSKRFGEIYVRNISEDRFDEYYNDVNQYVRALAYIYAISYYHRGGFEKLDLSEHEQMLKFLESIKSEIIKKDSGAIILKDLYDNGYLILNNDFLILKLKMDKIAAQIFAELNKVLSIINCFSWVNSGSDTVTQLNKLREDFIKYMKIKEDKKEIENFFRKAFGNRDNEYDYESRVKIIDYILSRSNNAKGLKFFRKYPEREEYLNYFFYRRVELVYNKIKPTFMEIQPKYNVEKIEAYMNTPQTWDDLFKMKYILEGRDYPLMRLAYIATPYFEQGNLITISTSLEVYENILNRDGANYILDKLYKQGYLIK